MVTKCPLGHRIPAMADIQQALFHQATHLHGLHILLIHILPHKARLIRQLSRCLCTPEIPDRFSIFITLRVRAIAFTLVTETDTLEQKVLVAHKESIQLWHEVFENKEEGSVVRKVKYLNTYMLK